MLSTFCSRPTRLIQPSRVTHDVRVLADDVGLRIELGDLVFGAERRAAIVAEFLRDLLQLGFDDFPQAGLFEARILRIVLGLGLLFLQLLEDAVDFQRRDAIQGQLEDRVGLLGIERERPSSVWRPRPALPWLPRMIFRAWSSPLKTIAKPSRM